MPPRKQRTDCRWRDHVPLKDKKDGNRVNYSLGVQGTSKEHDVTSDLYAPLGASSIDIGSRNFFCAYLELHVMPNTQGRKVQFKAFALEGIDLKEENKNATIEQIIFNLFLKTSNATDRLSWIFDLPSNLPILVERQVDQIKDFGNAENFGIYSSLMALCMVNQKPELLFRGSESLPADILAKSIEEPLQFTPRSGGQKYGLKEDRGGKRKERTGEVALDLLRRHGNHRAVRFMESLAKPKPYEDCGDVILQAAHYLLEQHNKRLDEHVRWMGYKGKERHAINTSIEYDEKESNGPSYIDLRALEEPEEIEEIEPPRKRARRSRNC